MRIEHLEIFGFRQFEHLKLDLRGSGTTVVAGANGSGKTNLLEALVLLFDALYRRAPPPFPYKIDYTRGSNRIAIEGHPPNGDMPYSFSVNGAPLSPFNFFGPAPSSNSSPLSRKSQYLPARVFLHTSGSGTRLERIFWRHSRYFRISLGQKEDHQILPSLFLVKGSHGPSALLLLFLLTSEKDREHLTPFLRPDGIATVTFIFQRPHRKGSEANWPISSSGRLGQLVGHLRNWADQRVETRRKVELDEYRTRSVDLETISIAGEKLIPRLRRWYRDREMPPKNFFRDLEALRARGYVYDISVYVYGPMGESLDAGFLSDGERQLLTTIGLLLYARENDSLILLDEPDTHLNPRWSQTYLRLLGRPKGEAESHALISTNDPMIVADARLEDLVVLETKDGRGRVAPPDFPARGAGINGLLTSNIFGLQTPLDITTQDLLVRKWRIESMAHPTEEELDDLRQLEVELWNSGLLLNDRDPVFREFQQAILRRGGPPRALSLEDRKARDALADEILQSLEDVET